jgi:hypothetical protein
LEQVEAYTTDAVMLDMSGDPPALVIMDEHPDSRFGQSPFDYLVFFARNPRFRALRSEYRRVGAVCICDLGPYVLNAHGSAPERSDNTNPALHDTCGGNTT